MVIALSVGIGGALTQRHGHSDNTDDNVCALYIKDGTMKKLTFVMMCLLLAAGMTGCFGASSRGEYDNLQFSYTSGDGCLFGCAVDREILKGSSEVIAIKGTKQLPISHIHLVAPGIVDAKLNVGVQCCKQTTDANGTTSSCRESNENAACDGPGEEKRYNYTIGVEAKSAGSVKLQVIAKDDSVYDQITVSVRTDAKQSLFINNNSASKRDKTITLVKGHSYKLSPALVDENGTTIQASGYSCQFKLDSSDILHFGQLVNDNKTEVTQSLRGGLDLTTPTLFADALGKASLTMECAGLGQTDTYEIIVQKNLSTP